MAGHLQVFCTLPSREQAAGLARSLIEQSLAACVQTLGPVASTYRWQAEVEQAEEWLCLIKTSTERYPELESAIRNQHPYDTPEIVAVPIVTGSRQYLDWLDAVMQPGNRHLKARPDGTENPNCR